MNQRTIVVVVMSLLLAGFGAASANAAPTTMVNLGQAAKYTVLAGPSITNTVSAPGAPHTTIRGDLGVKADTAPGGFPPGVVTGTIRTGSAVDPAHADMAAAYAEIAARQGGAPLVGALVGATIPPGLHTITGAASNTGTVTLDAGGDPSAVFVIQVTGALSFAAASHVVLTDGAQASRVFWQVNGAGAVGALADFAGTMIAKDAVGIGNGVIFNGRAFARDGAMTLDNNQFYGAPPLVTITGGAAAQTADETPTITGTTNAEAPATVTVTIAGQTLEATPVAGAWSVDSAILPNGTYPVVASTQDGAGNQGSATQQLTIDNVLPMITLDGGAAVTTNDATPTISGTTDAAEDTIVRVNVAGQNLRALVNAAGDWNVRPAALADGILTVTAAVSDPAGNESTVTQQLTVDTTTPAVTITGGATRLTNDATPEITGTAAVPAGTEVTVTVANDILTGLVDGAGAWTVTASALSDGPHRINMSVEDGAGNRATATQILTVDTVAPLITINGGATAATPDVDPTIAGTSDAAPGSIVTVTVDNRTMTALLQPNNTWNTNAGLLGNGTWDVLATVQDPAGNVGSASQTLSIGPIDNPVFYGLAVAKSGNGQGTVSSVPAGIDCGSDCFQDYIESSTITLSANPAAGSDFAGWNGACTGSTTCTVSMNQARSVTAEFVLEKRTLTVTESGNGSGVVNSNPAGSEFDYGTTVTLSADPATGSDFSSWSGACSGSTTCVVTMDQARTVGAEFVLEQPALTVNKTGNGQGTISSNPNGINCGADCSDDFVDGTSVNLSAEPATGSDFIGWSGACSGSATCVVTMDQARTVGAEFVLEKRALTVTQSGNGSGAITTSPTGGEFDYGTNVTLSADPATGSDFIGWSGACSGGGTCTVNMDQARSVAAGFVLEKHALSTSKTGNGSGQIGASPAGTEFAHGAQVTLTASPAGGSRFTGWGGACSGTSACTVTMDQARTVTAGFSDDAPRITKLTVTPKKVRASAKSKPTIKLGLSETANVEFRLTRKSAKAQTFQVQAQAGSSSTVLPKQIRKKLKKGSYELSAVATDSADQSSPSKRASFKLVR